MEKNIFDHVAPLYDLLEEVFLQRDMIIDKIDLAENKRILDVGGGTGMLLEKLSKKEPSIRTHLLDGSRQMIEESHFSEHKVIGRACHQPFKPDSFDLVLCIDALHHFENKKESLEEMVRVVKPGGEVMILEFDPKSPVTKFIEFGERLVGEPSYFLKLEVMKNFFSNRGFKTEIDRINSYEYILQGYGLG